MDLGKVRADLAVVAGEAGFNAWSYQPDDPQDLPAAVVGGIRQFTRLNQTVTQIDIGIWFYVNAADPEDATSRLDLVLSTGDPNSFIDLLDSVTTDDGPSWRSVHVTEAGPYSKITMPGGSTALGVEVILELTA